VDYLAAFYHGLLVKALKANAFTFTSWEDGKRRQKAGGKVSRPPSFVGLRTSKECVRVRARPSKVGTFAVQLNLNDILDVMIEALPSDAYALLLVVNHDIYEDEDDDFACGRAFGGSRVAVVSTARYHPMLDEQQDVDRRHAWPASHCSSYMHECCLKATEAAEAAEAEAIHEPKKKEAKTQA